MLASCAVDVCLDPQAMLSAIRTSEVKDELKRVTTRTGVRGVPTIQVGGRIFYGDDRLEEAASEIKR